MEEMRKNEHWPWLALSNCQIRVNYPYFWGLLQYLKIESQKKKPGDLENFLHTQNIYE